MSKVERKRFMPKKKYFPAHKSGVDVFLPT